MHLLEGPGKVIGLIVRWGALFEVVFCSRFLPCDGFEAVPVTPTVAVVETGLDPLVLAVFQFFSVPNRYPCSRNKKPF
jgi:hypothetical protein